MIWRKKGLLQGGGFFLGVAFWPGGTIQDWGSVYDAASGRFGLHPCNVSGNYSTTGLSPAAYLVDAQFLQISTDFSSTSILLNAAWNNAINLEKWLQVLDFHSIDSSCTRQSCRHDTLHAIHPRTVCALCICHFLDLPSLPLQPRKWPCLSLAALLTAAHGSWQQSLIWQLSMKPKMLEAVSMALQASKNVSIALFEVKMDSLMALTINHTDTGRLANATSSIQPYISAIAFRLGQNPKG